MNKMMMKIITKAQLYSSVRTKADSECNDKNSSASITAKDGMLAASLSSQVKNIANLSLVMRILPNPFLPATCYCIAEAGTQMQPYRP